MNDLKQQLITITPEVFSESPVLFAYLYGSHAKGQPHPFSDVDIAVFVKSIEKCADLNLELSLSLRLDERLNHRYSTEIRIINNLPLTVVGDILQHGHLIYSRDEAKRVEYETQSRMAYFDFLHIVQYHKSIYRKNLIAAANNGIAR